MLKMHVSALNKILCWSTSFPVFWKKLKAKYLCQLHVKYRSYWLKWIKITAVLNWTKIHSEFTDIKGVDGQTLPTNFVWNLVAFLLLTHEEHGKSARNATNWMSGWTIGPSGEARITQNFGELISYTNQSQWPRGLRRGVCGRPLTGIVSSNIPVSMDICLSWMLCFQVQFSASGWVLQTVVCPVIVIAKPRHGKPWPGMRSNRHGRGGGALVQKPCEVKVKGNKNWLVWVLRT